MSGAECHKGRIYKGKCRRHQADMLHVGSPHVIRSVDVPCHAHDRKNAGIYHRHGVQKGRHRRRCDGGQRKPPGQREQRRLGAETEKAEQKRQKKHRITGSRVKAAAVLEIGSSAVQGCQHHCKEGQGCSADGIRRIDSPGVHAFMVSVMGHQRKRHQRQHLIKHIQGRHVAGKGNSQGNAVGHDIKGKEYILKLRMLQVFEGVQQHNRPHDGHHSGKQHGKAVHRQVNGKSPCKRVKFNPLSSSEEQGNPDQNGCQAAYRLRINLSWPVLVKARQDNPGSADNRHKNRNQ